MNRYWIICSCLNARNKIVCTSNSKTNIVLPSFLFDIVRLCTLYWEKDKMNICPSKSVSCFVIYFHHLNQPSLILANKQRIWRLGNVLLILIKVLRARLVAARPPCQIVAWPNFGAEMGHPWLAKEGLQKWTTRVHWSKGQPNFGCHPNGVLAHGQRPIFGLATDGSHPNKLSLLKSM